MFSRFFKTLNANNNNGQSLPFSELETHQRRHQRRDNDRCVALIENKVYPIQNWSIGGALIRADERLFSVDDEIGLTIKFKFENDMRDVTQLARVIRKNSNNIAFQFAPLTGKGRKNFESILNECMNEEFAHSQMAQ
ncbi:MAG: hypothetical protein CMH26_05450 [Micavibrio sp.]|nr:hypothetical protein [Micavibrio sp.]|tara:strand:- start:518 stop:928 length:411 start_codon:yes stop_codon:yes gene_type:complete